MYMFLKHNRIDGYEFPEFYNDLKVAKRKMEISLSDSTIICELKPKEGHMIKIYQKLFNNNPTEEHEIIGMNPHV